MNFNDLIKANRGRATLLDCLNKSCYAALLSLILAQQPHFLELRPAEAAQYPEVFKLQNSALAKNLQPLLRKTLTPVGEVVHSTDGTIAEAELQTHSIPVASSY